MSKMSFMPGLLTYLKLHGQIYTVREYYSIDNEVLIDNIKYKRTLIKFIRDKYELDPYWYWSGFTNLDSWWERIVGFIPEPDGQKWLYKVERHR